MRRYEVRGPASLVGAVRERCEGHTIAAVGDGDDDPWSRDRLCAADPRDGGGDGDGVGSVMAFITDDPERIVLITRGRSVATDAHLVRMAHSIPHGLVLLAACMDLGRYPAAARIVALSGGTGERIFDAPMPALIVAAIYFSGQTRRGHAAMLADNDSAFSVDDLAVHFTEDEDGDDDSKDIDAYAIDGDHGERWIVSPASE
ncbi:MAG TPA: hypothetical protein VIO38_16880 [Rariglobus sp.]